MNLSGMAVRELAEKYELRPESDLMVIYDELDLPLGKIRIRERGSSEARVSHRHRIAP